MSNTSFAFKYRRHLSQNDPDDSDSDSDLDHENPDDPDEGPAPSKKFVMIQKPTGKTIENLSGLTLVSPCRLIDGS